MSAVTVVVVDDHPLFRQGLVVALQGRGRFVIVGEASGADEAIAILREREIEIAIIDLLMPGRSGLSLASEIRELQPGCRILVLSVIDDPGLIADALRAGACGFAVKTQPVDEIIDAIDQVLGGIRYLPPAVSSNAVDATLAEPQDAPLERLTPREREVFELLIRGYSNDEIAAKLFISRRTVETHRLRVTSKLSARSIAQMQRVAALHGGLVS